MSAHRCLDDDDVQSLARGALSPDEAAPMLAHVGTCDLCRALLACVARQHTTPSRGEDAPATLPSAFATASLPHGARTDRYVVQERVGDGGMGVVYAAYDPQLERRVALKLVRTDHARSPELRQRLVREAQVMARVSHPNVLTVYDAGILGDQVFIAMELVVGGTLTEWLRAQPRSWREVVDRFVDAGRGLAAAHALGIVHRDFKPDNVLVGKDGRVRVSDFGLAIAEHGPAATAPSEAAAARGPSAHPTADGRLVGTPAYMAPEQMNGGVVDARTDQFSFCVALHEALTGARPGSRRATRSGHRVRGHVPARARRAIARGLSPSPEDRFPSMETLVRELEPRAGDRLTRITAIAGLVLVAFVAAAGAAHSRNVRRDAHAFVRSVHRLTYAPGCEEYPSFASSDGAIVFDGEVDGAQQLFTFDIASGTTRQLTLGPGAHRAALVSPDGRRMAYEHQLDGPRELRLKRLDGTGDERTLGPGSTMGGSWLDDRRLALIAKSGAVLVLDVEAPGATPEPLYPDPGHHRFGLTATFADGTLATSFWDPPSGMAFGLLSPAGLTVLVEKLPYVDSALRIAPREDAFYYVRRAGAANELVRLPRQGGAPEVVAGGVAPSRGIAISRDAARLVFSTCVAHAQLARIGDDRSAVPLFRRQPWSDAVPAPLDSKRILFASDRSGHDQLYVANIAGDGEPRAVTGLDVEQGTPSPDGLWIVYSTHDPGGLWLLPVDGSAPPRHLTDGAHDESPVFSRDGATIFFVRSESLFAIARTGGEPRAIAGPGVEPTPSPVDDRLFFLQRPTAPTPARIMSVDARGAVAQLDVTLPSGNYWSPTVSPDGRTLAIVREGFEVVEVPLDGRGPARVRTRQSHWISSLHYTFDGDALWASLESLDGDLWIAEGEFP